MRGCFSSTGSDVPRAGFLIDQMQRISQTLGSAAVPDSAEAIDLAWLLHLGGDSHLQIAVQLPDLLGALAQFAQEPRILHRNHRLRRKILQ